MMPRWLKNVPHFVSSALGVVRLAWEAHPWFFIGIFLLTMLQGLMPLATAWVMKVLFDLLAQGLQGDRGARLHQDLLILLVAQAFLSVTSQMVVPAYNYLDADLGRRLTVKVQSIVYAKINSFVGIAYFETPRFHDTIRLAAQGAEFGPRNSLTNFTNLLRSSITLVAFLGVMVAFNPLLAVLVSLAALPHLAIELRMGRQRSILALKNSPKERRLFYFGSLLSELSSAKEVRLFGLTDYLLNRLLGTFREIHQARRAQEQHQLRWQLVQSTLSSLVAAGAFGAVVIQAFRGGMSLGDITLYVNALGSVQGSLGSLILALSFLNESVLFHAHFTDLLALPQPLPVASPGRQMSKLERGIELRNVSFRYTDQHPWILRNVNLFLPAGKCLALVGLNGAGKTTLVKLLTRLYDPTEGQILWDGIDIREIDPVELRRRIGVVFQDFLQYDLTARENIGFGNIDHLDDDASIRRAAADAGVHTLIEGLPQGYQTILSRWLADDGPGVDLSRGEWQKISVARIFMRDADLLILDEPTSFLDAQAEHEFYNRFLELVTGRTSLLISHRFSTVRMADAIAVLADGQITEYGSHAELLALGGVYARLYSLQAEQYADGTLNRL